MILTCHGTDQVVGQIKLILYHNTCLLSLFGSVLLEPLLQKQVNMTA